MGYEFYTCIASLSILQDVYLYHSRIIRRMLQVFLRRATPERNLLLSLHNFFRLSIILRKVVDIIHRSAQSRINLPYQPLHFVFGALSHVNTASLPLSKFILPQTLAAFLPKYSWLVVAFPSATSLPSNEMCIPVLPQMSMLAQKPS